MANTFITPQQLVEDMLDFAREYVAKLPIETVRDFAEVSEFRIGIGGAGLACLTMASIERLEREGKVQP